MKTRRDFIKTTAVGAVGIAAVGCANAATDTEKITEEQTTGQGNSPGPEWPVIASTWNHGLAANEAAKSKLGILYRTLEQTQPKTERGHLYLR